MKIYRTCHLGHLSNRPAAIASPNSWPLSALITHDAHLELQSTFVYETELEELWKSFVKRCS